MWATIFTKVAGFATSRLGLSSATIIAVLIGAWIGFQISQMFFVPDPVKVIEYVQAVQEEQQEALEEIQVNHARRNVQIRIVEKIVPKEVIKYVPKDDPVECNIPIGSVGLLNDARAGRIREDDMPGTPELSVEEGSAPSTLTRRELIQSDAEIAIMYNDVANQLNALIDFIEAQQKSLNQ